MSVRKNFQGGIYCVIPMGMIYDERIRKSANRKFYKLFSKDADILSAVTLNQGIVYELSKFMNREMETLKYQTFTGMTVSAPDVHESNNARYVKIGARADWLEDVKDQIEQSYGFAIYHNGKNVATYVAPFAGSVGGKSRIMNFFTMNKNKLPSVGSVGKGNINNWNIVIAVAHNIAARFEAHDAYPDRMYKGFGKRVLLIWAQVMANAIRSKFGRVDRPVQYGYILSREGYEGRVFRSNDIAVV